MDWDNYSNEPSYFKIPVVSTPSPSLAGSIESLDQLFTPTSVIMTVKRCTKCHKYISGAPSPELAHVGTFGIDCKSDHHPNPCTYVSKENVACGFFSRNDSINNDSQPEPSAQLIQDNQQLLLSLNRVDTLMRMFPVSLMTMDRLKSYESELEKIREKYMEFSENVILFAMNHPASPIFVSTHSGTIMNIEYWQQKEAQFGAKINDHQLEIRNCATGLVSSRNMSEFERKEIEIKERELKLKEEQLKLMRQSQTKSEQAEKDKANALALSKYEEINLLSTELDEFLDEEKDWTKASRSEVMTAMKTLDKWSSKFNELNKAHRDFVVSTSIHTLPNEAETVDEIINETTRKYKVVTAAIKLQDTQRELYSLAGSSKDSVRLPKFGGTSSENFSIFKSKLLLAFEKNMVPVSDKIEKLRSCLSGPALALVPEKSTDFTKAMETLGDAFGNPERVLSVRIGELKKLGSVRLKLLTGSAILHPLCLSA